MVLIGANNGQCVQTQNCICKESEMTVEVCAFTEIPNRTMVYKRFESVCAMNIYNYKHKNYSELKSKHIF